MPSVSHSTIFIKQLLAALLIGVFTLGITPKKTLHNLVSNHIDSNSKIKESKWPQLSKAGFNCKCDNLVAESNFIAGSTITTTFPAVFRAGFTTYYSLTVSLPRILHNLRGPPSNS